MELTICLLTKNNEATIEQTLHSIKSLNAKVLVGDAESVDKTKSISIENNADIIDIELKLDRSEVKNNLLKKVKTKWVMFLEPWEIVIQGHEHIKEVCDTARNAYRFQILQSNVITKDVRLWHIGKGLKFQRPVFEGVSDNSAKHLDVILYSQYLADLGQKKELLKNWCDTRPTDSESTYYKASILLAEGDIEGFIAVAGHYLFLEKQGIPATMTKYHLAMAQCYAKNDLSSSLKNILPCLAIRPTMAEFWCLLGDIYYKRSDYEKAGVFYDNAILMGSRRLSSDAWPMDISKYNDHPRKMKNSCDEMIASTVTMANG